MQRPDETPEDYRRRISDTPQCEVTLGQVVKLGAKDMQFSADVCLTCAGLLAEPGPSGRGGGMSTFVGRGDKQTGVSDRGVVASKDPEWDELREALTAAGLPG